jgi:hypothetical protein
MLLLLLWPTRRVQGAVQWKQPYVQWKQPYVQWIQPYVQPLLYCDVCFPGTKEHFLPSNRKHVLGHIFDHH